MRQAQYGLVVSMPLTMIGQEAMAAGPHRSARVAQRVAEVPVEQTATDPYALNKGTH